MPTIAITGTGIFLPADKISNEELVTSFNTYVDDYNLTNQTAIDAGSQPALQYSSVSFIEKASGIHNRYVIDKKGLLDPKRMRPYIPARPDEMMSFQCEMACQAVQQALGRAQKTPADVDGIIVSCCNVQRPYPAMAIEIQHALGMQRGYGFDMNVACSSTTFGIATAYNALSNGQQCIVVINPEITSGHMNFRDRDSHFIFGDVCTAIVLERTNQKAGFEILGTKLHTSFSNNIRNNSGFMNHVELEDNDAPIPLKLFKQNGRKVFKEVVPMVEEHILAHLASLNLGPQDVKRYWLHQANINMNELIIKRILGREPLPLEAPIILDEYANTASAGSLIAFHHYHEDMQTGDLGVICSFGAGYSIGSIIIRKE